MSEIIKNRYEFVVLFDVENGNPNGDPDAGNMPRIDPESGYGLVTDVCLKRKIRNYVETVKEEEEGYRIYIKENVPLNRSDNEAYLAVGATDKTVKELKKKDPEVDRKICDFMCRNFYDIRTFGAVMTTFVKAALNCGQVRGPVQLGFARSADPIISQEVAITRVAITTEKDAEDKQTEMGRKNIVPYALYRAEGYISANLARKVTGFSEDDLELLWEAIINMFEHDHSAARGKMAVRRLIVFKHSKELGDCPSYIMSRCFQLLRHSPFFGIVAVNNRSPDGRKCLIRMSYCGYAQVCFPVVRHRKPKDARIITVKDGRNIKRSVTGWNLSDIRHAFFKRLPCCEITLEKVV